MHRYVDASRHFSGCFCSVPVEQRVIVRDDPARQFPAGNTRTGFGGNSAEL